MSLCFGTLLYRLWSTCRNCVCPDTWLVVLDVTLGSRKVHVLQSFNLIKGYTHWASGRISQIEVNLESPLLYCHVHLTMHDPFDEARQLSPMTVAGKEWNYLKSSILGMCYVRYYPYSLAYCPCLYISCTVISTLTINLFLCS